MAAANNAYKCAESLLTVSPTVNVSDRTGRTALHHAAFSGHCELVELLIKNGASVNAFDKRDRRALHWAAYMGHEAVVKILLQSGAEVNIRDKELYTPLHAVIILLLIMVKLKLLCLFFFTIFVWLHNEIGLSFYFSGCCKWPSFCCATSNRGWC